MRFNNFISHYLFKPIKLYWNFFLEKYKTHMKYPKIKWSLFNSLLLIFNDLENCKFKTKLIYWCEVDCKSHICIWMSKLRKILTRTEHDVLNDEIFCAIECWIFFKYKILSVFRKWESKSSIILNIISWK